MTDLRDAAAAAGLVVARRPVVDRSRAVVGFELVHRPAPASGLEDLPGAARHREGDGTGREPADEPTDEVSGEAGSEAGSEAGGEAGIVTVAALLGAAGIRLEDVVGEAAVHCRVERDTLVAGPDLGLDPRRTVLEVRADDLDDGLREACRSLRADGYTVAVDGLADVADLDTVAGSVDLVRLRLDGPDSRGRVGELADRCRAAGLRLVADGCTTDEDLAWAEEQGFELFQGPAVQTPEIPMGSTIEPSALSQVRLCVELLHRDLSLDRLEMILRGEPGLVVQVLDLASRGAAGGAYRRVRSLREALVVLGSVRMRQWVAVIVLGRHGRQQADALVTALVRARMCELLAEQRGMDRSLGFTAGLLSTLDQLLGVSLAEVERRLDVDDALAAAAFRGEGTLGVLVASARDYQSAVGSGATPPRTVGDLSLVAAMAFCWAASFATLAGPGA